MTVSLVIPAHNAARTLADCLRGVARLDHEGRPDEVLVVDDRSQDDTAVIAMRSGARVLKSIGKGPAAARNTGWRVAVGEFVWFLDADCVPRPDALTRLIRQLGDDQIAGAGGSYENLQEQSQLAWLIQEEISTRHAIMPRNTWLLATYNVLYRRAALQRTGGFDEAFAKAQDAELSYRLRAEGEHLVFDALSIVGHFHETSWPGYLKTQAAQGYWRAHLYRRFHGRAGGDGYSSWTDHLQPPLAVAAALGLAFGTVSPAALAVGIACCGGVLACSLPITLSIRRRTESVRAFAYVPFTLVRALVRGLGFGCALMRILVELVTERWNDDRG